METGLGLIDAISESVKLVNYNGLSVMQDEIISQTGNGGVGVGVAVAGEIRQDEFGVALLPETSDLIYTDLSYNVKQEEKLVPVWEGMNGGALNQLVSGNSSQSHTISGLPDLSLMNGAGINEGFEEELDRVSCPTPSLSDNLSFLSDYSETDKVSSVLKEVENEYVKAWISKDQENSQDTFTLPLLSAAGIPQVEGVGNGPGTSAGVKGEGDVFSTINVEDLDQLMDSVAATGLKCGDCSKTFNNPLTLQIHMRLHTGERPYKCKKCGEGFIHYSYLEYHNNNTHGEGKGVAPSPINANGNEPHLSPHQNTIPATGYLETASEILDSGKPGSKAKQSNGSKASARTKEGLGGPYKCNYCHKGFKHSSWLTMHLRIHTGEKPYQCTHCELSFAQRGNLMQHLKKHNLYLNGSITDAAMAHNSVANSSSPSLTSTPTPISNVTSSNLTLRRIKKKKTAPQDQNMIGNESHGKDTDAGKKGKRPVKCTICGEAFRERKALVVHMRNHGGKQFACSHCERRFRQAAHLQKHVRDMHNGGSSIKTIPSKKDEISPNSAPYYQKYNLVPCEVQLNRFKTDSSEGSHENLVAKKKGKKPKLKKSDKTSQQKPPALPTSGNGHTCTICNKVLLTTTNLTVHMRIHTGEKPYQCSHCKKKFSVQSNLKAHVRLHTGEKPYSCSLCATEFATRGNFTAHLRSHGINPYKCSLCTEQFTFSWKLKKHMLAAHNKKMKAEHKVLLT